MLVNVNRRADSVPEIQLVDAKEAHRTFGDALPDLPPGAIVDHKIGRRVSRWAPRIGRARSAATANADELQR